MVYGLECGGPQLGLLLCLQERTTGQENLKKALIELGMLPQVQAPKPALWDLGQVGSLWRHMAGLEMVAVGEKGSAVC